jgi:hypothetical protein
MSAMTEIPAHFPTEFATNWEMLAQQKLSRLKDMVSLHRVNGKETSFNQMDAIEMSRVTTRAGETRISDINLAKRWLRPLPYDLATLFDEWDGEFLGQIVLPSSDTVQAHGAAYARACDDVLIAAATGSAYTGDAGTTPTALPATQQVAVNYVETGSGNSGLTIAKLRAAAYIFDSADLDPDEPRFIAVSAKQIQDLLKTTEVTNNDYNSVQALVQGKVDSFMGFKFVRTQRLAIDSGTSVRTCFAWVKSGLKFTDAGRSTKMDVIPTRSHALQIRTVASLGATRTEEKKVVEIACDEVI